MAYDNRIPSYEDLRAFSLVYMRAVALAWDDSETGRTFKSLFLDRPEQALEQYFNYKCPWAINLVVREACAEDPGSGWDPKAGIAGKWRLPRNRVVFGIPTKPEAPLSEAIGLAAYTDSGPNYLFSCC